MGWSRRKKKIKQENEERGKKLRKLRLVKDRCEGEIQMVRDKLFDNQGELNDGVKVAKEKHKKEIKLLEEIITLLGGQKLQDILTQLKNAEQPENIEKIKELFISELAKLKL